MSRSLAMLEHAVIVDFLYGSTDLTELHALEEGLGRAIAAAGVGEFGDKLVGEDGSDVMLFLYGPDADALFAAVETVLRRCRLTRGAHVTKRYGPPQDYAAREEVVVID